MNAGCDPSTGLTTPISRQSIIGWALRANRHGGSPSRAGRTTFRDRLPNGQDCPRKHGEKDQGVPDEFDPDHCKTGLTRRESTGGLMDDCYAEIRGGLTFGGADKVTVPACEAWFNGLTTGLGSVAKTVRLLGAKAWSYPAGFPHNFLTCLGATRRSIGLTKKHHELLKPRVQEGPRQELAASTTIRVPHSEHQQWLL